jgi:hypothetical protein
MECVERAYRLDGERPSSSLDDVGIDPENDPMGRGPAEHGSTGSRVRVG